MDDLSK